MEKIFLPLNVNLDNAYPEKAPTIVPAAVVPNADLYFPGSTSSSRSMPFVNSSHLNCFHNAALCALSGSPHRPSFVNFIAASNNASHVFILFGSMPASSRILFR